MKRNVITVLTSSSNMAEPSENDYRDILTEYFTLQEQNGVVSCNLCDDFSCEIVESVQINHLKTKHGYQETVIEDYVSRDDVLEDENPDEGLTIEELDLDIADPRRRRKSSVWLFFDKEDDSKATCRFCRKRLSYRTSATNLTKHLLSQHSVEAVCDGKQMSLDSDDNQVTIAVVSEGSDRRNRSTVWKYFKRYSREEKVATCLLCGANRSYKTSITNLKRHIERKHSDANIEDLIRDADVIPKKEIQEESETEAEEIETLSHSEAGLQANRTDRHSSILWLYYVRIDERAKIAECKLCDARISYLSSNSNLKKHLRRAHSDVAIPTTEDGRKRMLLSTKGELFEIAVRDDSSDDNNKQPNPNHALSLEDFDADSEQGTSTEQKPKVTKADDINITESGNETDSSDDGFQLTRKQSDSLDRFGKYLVSLLRQLPKTVSNQLQADFVGQVMKAQTNYDNNM